MSGYNRKCLFLGVIVLSAMMGCKMKDTGTPPQILLNGKDIETDLSETLTPISKRSSWSGAKREFEKKEFQVFHDRMDNADTFTVTVGWDREHKIFRSYKVVVSGDYIVEIKPDYSYPGL